MKELFFVAIMTTGLVYTANERGLWDSFRQRAEVVHNYEYKSLELSKKIRLLQKENFELKADLSKLQAEKDHLAMMSGNSAARSIASIKMPAKDDLVKFDVYKWTPEKLHGVGSKELHFKNYEKAAQFYAALLKHYPNYSGINDKLLFEAGIASYESKQHYDWAQEQFSSLIQKYPKSKLQRGAKLWLGLSHFHKGDKEEFLATVEEFKKKYRNTREWKLLSKHYEEIAYKYGNRK